MSKRSDFVLIEDIKESCLKIINYTEGYTQDQFVADSKTVDAVIRNFEIIGEAANRLSDDFKDKYPTIDWHKIRGFRNRIVHDYAGVDVNIVWVIITEYLPGMFHDISAIA